jgi:GYF domain 2
MKYYIRRDLKEFGPYTLADLQRYVAQGNIVLTDLTRREGMNDWVPVSQVIGSVPQPTPPVTAQAGPGYDQGGEASGTGAAYGGATFYSGTPPYGGQVIPATQGPIPPDFHWGLVLLIGILTCGIFFWVWLLVEAAFVKKIRPQSNGLVLAIVAMICSYGGPFIRVFGMWGRMGIWPLGGLLSLASLVLVLIAVFSMKSDLEQYYNSVEPINLRLNGLMVFFLAVFYFQHHFSRISRWKKTGVLEPQR